MPSCHIEIASVSLSADETDRTFNDLLRTYDLKIPPEVRSGVHPLVLQDKNGNVTRITVPELLADLHLTGACEIDRLRWLDTDPFGSIAVEVPEGLPLVIGTGFRNSPPLLGPGYATNDVVTEFLEDILLYRCEVARHSSPGDMYKSAFRAYRNYLTACVSAIDAYLNKLSWFKVNDPSKTLTDTQIKLLSRKSLPLDEKIRLWLPLLAGGAAISETGQAWGDYQEIKRARNAFVHVNEPEFFFTPREATDILNLCRTGVGGLIASVYEHLRVHPSPAILRVSRAPRARFMSHI
jgi:hypothetical protein